MIKLAFFSQGHKDFLSLSFLAVQGEVEASHILLLIQVWSFNPGASLCFVKALKQVSLQELSICLTGIRKTVCSLKNICVMVVVYLLCNLYRPLLTTSAAAKMLQDDSYISKFHSKFKWRLSFRLLHQTRLLHIARTLSVGWKRTAWLLYFVSTTGTEAALYEIQSQTEFL